ncbi:MAG TPA: hypothetical protein VNU66_00865 [Mycobacteriales bacterium]|nr:hypothetical protein [Mycobacteriales bacterium]
MSRSEYVEGERVFGPPLGTYDADWVASAALEATSASPEVVRRLAAAAWPALRAGAPDLAAALRTAVPRAPESAVQAVARTALGWCREYGVGPAG